MRSPSVSDWMQLITLVAIVLGLALVVWELRQQREFAESQHVGSEWDRYSSGFQAMMGDDVPSAIAKACDHPKSLTTEDMVTLSFYYSEVLNRIRSQHSMSAVTSLQTFNWEVAAQANFQIIFGTSFGRKWWGEGTLESEIREFGNRMLAELPEEPVCASYFDSLRESDI